MDIYLQSPRYVSPKTRYEAAKCLPRVEVAKGACYATQSLCVAMYVQETSTKRVMFANYIFANITSFAKFAKISSRENFQVHGRHLLLRAFFYVTVNIAQ